MMRYSKLYFLSITSTLILAIGCADANESVNTEEATPDPEKPTLECQADGGTIIGTWKCAENTLSLCVAGKWVVNQTCPENTTCNAAKGLCDPNVAPECADGTWKCEGNTLSRCIAGKWEIRQACPENALCNSDTGTCDIDEPECTNNTWSCDGNTLSKCVAETWKTIQTCEAPAQCNEETGACEIECKDTEHLFAERCEADDITHCGTHTNDCTKMSGWKTGNCIGKKCFAEECETGYHLASIFDSDNKERTICQEDTHDACGSINTQCGAEEICTLGECKDTCRPGEVVCGGSCINPNTSTNFCGADASCSSFIPCSEFEECIGGKCVLSSCQDEAESLCTGNDQNICVNIHGSNINHCGACGAVCADKETAKTSGCAQGQCTYSCNDNMVNCGSNTEPMCLQEEQLKTDPLHCGQCDTKCKANEYCQNGKCLVSSCTGNECLLDNACINQNDHCGTQCVNCNTANLASAGICQEGTCVITACIAGYHLTDKGVCEIDSATACPNGNANGTANCNTLEYTKSGVCVESICKAVECHPNAHIKGNICVKNTINKCGSEDNDCTKLAGWKAGSCENGKCVATSCQNEFCLNTLQGQCTQTQSSTTCGIDGNACQSCTIKQVCSVGACVAKKCNGNVCQQPTGADQEDLCQNDNTHCGSACQNCNTFTSHATAGTCSNTGTCQVTACEAGYHVYNNACEADSTTNCGSHGTQCNVANANNACLNKTCTFTCNSGYHEYNNACEADSETNCGAHNTQCAVENAYNECSNAACTFICNSKYHQYNNACEADSTTNCGAHGTQCNVENAYNMCNNKTCTFTCDAGYHAYNGTCEADSTTNCGAHGTQCNVENATNLCNAGNCTFTCDAGYHANNNACEADSTTNCGGQGATCNVENATNTCQNGKCMFTCNSGYHEYNDACEADSTANCGAQGTQCNVENATNTCSNGNCSFTCDANYHAYDGTCEADSTANCGAHGTQCNVENATNTCQNKVCTFTCNQDYHTYNNACEADSTTNCGAHGTQCNIVANATNMCSDGACTFTCDDGYHTYNDICEAHFIGGTVIFGNYNGTPIQWYILDHDAVNHRIMLLAIDVLEEMKFSSSTEAYWQNCTLRRWLNGSLQSFDHKPNFISTAFTNDERTRIPQVTVVNENNPQYGTYGGPNTEDWIFLLSIAEVQTLLGTGDTMCTKIHCTRYWWLRSPGADSKLTAYIRNEMVNGDYLCISGMWITDQNNIHMSVRPAMWLNY
ncbi:MAG: hypothetical protein IJ165_04300 [Proteobacteria bacterium]|nr:hypothetical protein [Pseudomonadota bacterium]